VRTLYRTKWVFDLRPPFGGPGKALEYLSCYTHRVAISNQRLISFEQGQSPSVGAIPLTATSNG